MHGISMDEVWMRYGSSYGLCMDWVWIERGCGYGICVDWVWNKYGIVWKTFSCGNIFWNFHFLEFFFWNFEILKSRFSKKSENKLKNENLKIKFSNQKQHKHLPYYSILIPHSIHTYSIPVFAIFVKFLQNHPVFQWLRR